MEVSMLSLDSGILFRVPALLIAITVHEYAHGQMSYSLGDPTPKLEGRLTMNPLAHLDVMGAIMLVLVGFGWAKPVGINPAYYKNYKQDIMKVAFAGPGANLLLCFLATFLILFLGKLGFLSQGVYQFLRWLQLYNVWFAFFNLIPIPPLDGSKILMALLPSQKAYAYEQTIAPYSMYILIAICFTGIVSTIITPFATLYMGLVNLVLGVLF
jgi:Zn-dependent protease